MEMLLSECFRERAGGLGAPATVDGSSAVEELPQIEKRTGSWRARRPIQTGRKCCE
jgi:hypothetical protein